MGLGLGVVLHPCLGQLLDLVTGLDAWAGSQMLLAGCVGGGQEISEGGSFV